MPTIIWSSSIRTTKAAIRRKRQKMLELSPGIEYTDGDIVNAMLAERELERQETEARLAYPLPGALYLCHRPDDGSVGQYCKRLGDDLSDALSDLPYYHDIDVIARGWDLVAKSDMFHGRLVFRMLKPGTTPDQERAFLDRVAAYGVTDRLFRRYTVSVLPYVHAAIGCPCPDGLKAAAGNPAPKRKKVDVK